MPFKSKAQQRFMFATHPRIAKRWADKTKNMKKLPEHVKEKSASVMDRIKGGLADNKKDSEFNKKNLKKGQKVEREHSTDKSISKEIAKDHLSEDPKYYDKLEKIEKKAFFKTAQKLKKRMSGKYC